MISERQEKILRDIVEYYLDTAQPVSSNFLKEKSGFDCSPATIRNDLQDLMEKGYISQPHTSAGRVPTPKAYHYYVQVVIVQHETLPDFIARKIEEARANIKRELHLARNLTKELEETLAALHAPDFHKHVLSDILEMLGPSRNVYEKHVSTIKELIRELENF